MKYDATKRASRSAVTFHHQNPFTLPHLIDQRAKSTGSKKRNTRVTSLIPNQPHVSRAQSNENRQKSKPSIEKRHSVDSPVVSKPGQKKSKIKIIKTDIPDESNRPVSPPQSPNQHTIPPPWKTISVDVSCRKILSISSQ